MGIALWKPEVRGGACATLHTSTVVSGIDMMQLADSTLAATLDSRDAMSCYPLATWVS